jgi:hypothetical protein
MPERIRCVAKSERSSSGWRFRLGGLHRRHVLWVVQYMGYVLGLA